VGRGLPDKQEHGGEAEEQDGAFVGDGGVVEAVELDPAGVGLGSALDRDHLTLQAFHAVAHRELGRHRQYHHKDDAGRSVPKTGKIPLADQASHKKQQSQKYACNVKTRKGIPHQQTGGIAILENPEGPRRHDKAEKRVRSEPQTQA